MEFTPESGETVLLYTDGLLRRTGDSTDRAFSRLHAAAAGVPRTARHDPEAVADHVLRTLLPGQTPRTARTTWSSSRCASTDRRARLPPEALIPLLASAQISRVVQARRAPLG